MYEISEAFENLLICTSRFLNTLVGGVHNEMLSSRAYREQRLYLMRIIDTLFFWEKDHCKECYEWEIEENKKCSILP